MADNDARMRSWTELEAARCPVPEACDGHSCPRCNNEKGDKPDWTEARPLEER